MTRWVAQYATTELHNEKVTAAHTRVVIGVYNMKVIIAGSRGFADYQRLEQEMLNFTADAETVTVISGTARGADQLGERWAHKFGHHVIRIPAEWNKYGRSAGYRRNEEMAKITTHCVCFWDGTSPGTRHMIDIARHRGLVVHVELV